MTIFTKGMGAIMKAVKGKPKKVQTFDEVMIRRSKKPIKSRKVSDLKKAGKTFKTQNVSVDRFGKEKVSYRYVTGPLKGFTMKPYMPGKRGQGKLFREKFEKPKKESKQLKFKFPPMSTRPGGNLKRLETNIKKAEVK